MGLLIQELPAANLERAVSAANGGNWVGATGPATEAAGMDPNVSSYLYSAGLAASRAGSHLAAADYFGRVAARDDLPEAWLNLAAERSDLGQHDEALDALRNALVLGQQRPAVSMPIGELALRLGDLDLARHAFTAALLARPSLAADPWWTDADDRHRVFDEALRIALAQAVPSTAWELDLMIGDYDGAAILAKTSGVAAAPLVTQAWAGDEAAAVTLKGRCVADPLDIETLLWCARIEGRRGDLRQANAFREMASIASSGAFEIGAELRVATSGTGTPMFGSPADFWGTYTYRRPTPNDVLVPSLIHLKLE
jgi:Tetratricopeptide repeat.